MPIYQPGSVMFEAGVESNCEIAIKVAGHHKNGPVMGNSCSLFLAKFLCKLCLKYFRLCLHISLDPQTTLDQKIYK